MAKSSWIVVVAWATIAQVARAEYSVVASATGESEQLRLTVSAYEDSVAPGESLRIASSAEVLVDGPLQFPSGHSRALDYLFLQTPTGQLIVYFHGGSPRSQNPAPPVHYKNRQVLQRKGERTPSARFEFQFVDEAPQWDDAKTYEPVFPNLRAVGVYEAWARYTVSEIEGAPELAWHGTVETDRIRITVRELPVADRRTEPTPEQLAHLQHYMREMENLGRLADAEEPAPDAVELPPLMNVVDRLTWAFEQTENEGLARYAVKLLRDSQPQDDGQEYPSWWSNVDFFVRQRALYHRHQGIPALRIIGPYVDDYADFACDDLERQFQEARSFSRPGPDMAILLAYLDHNPEGTIAQRVEALARKNAKLPEEPRFNEEPEWLSRVQFSRTALLTLGVLHDGMPLAEAIELLGEPTRRNDQHLSWFVETGSRGKPPSIEGKVVHSSDEDAIEFTGNDLGASERRVHQAAARQ